MIDAGIVHVPETVIITYAETLAMDGADWDILHGTLKRIDAGEIPGARYTHHEAHVDAADPVYEFTFDSLIPTITSLPERAPKTTTEVFFDGVWHDVSEILTDIRFSVFNVRTPGIFTPSIES